MPIRPFLAGQPFEPELIQQMSLALETVCGKLNLNLTDDPATRLVASKIIELAQRGVHDAPTLSAMTLKEFKHFLIYISHTSGSLAILAAIRCASSSSAPIPSWLISCGQPVIQTLCGWWQNIDNTPNSVAIWRRARQIQPTRRG